MIRQPGTFFTQVTVIDFIQNPSKWVYLGATQMGILVRMIEKGEIAKSPVPYDVFEANKDDGLICLIDDFGRVPVFTKSE
jgi:hypothetical protein